MKLLSSFLDLLFPPKCPFCGRVLDAPGICDACRKALPWTEGADALRLGPDGFRCAAPLWYRDLARDSTASSSGGCPPPPPRWGS